MEMIRRLISVAVAAVMVVSFLLTMPVSASPGDIHVPEQYTTIQAAINNVDPTNRTILVNALTYNETETVVVDKSNIIIRSANGSAVVTAGGADDHVFNITNQTNVTLEGFTIRDARGTSKDVAGIFMQNVTACNISNNVVTNITATGSWNARGIWLDDSHNNTFGSSTTVSHVNATGNAAGILLYRSDNNTFSSSTDVSHVNATNGTAGILLYLSDNNTFSSSTNVSYVNGTNSSVGMLLDVSVNNAFGSSTTVSYVNATDEAVGIVLRGAANNTLDETVVENVDSAAGDAVGVGLSHSADNEFYDCTIADLSAAGNVSGLAIIDGSDNNTISRGRISSNIKYGVYMENCRWNSILDSEIADSTYGIYIHDKFCSNLISGNRIHGNEFGIYLLDTWDNKIWDNEIRDNSHGVWVAGTGDGSYNNTIIRNMIVNNSGHTGVHLGDGSHDNKSYQNCLIDNDPQARDDGTNNDWNGNYWSDYTGPGPYIIEGTANSTDDDPLDECPLAPPPPVGGEAYSVNRLTILAPWVVALALLAGGAGWLALRRRRARS